MTRELPARVPGYLLRLWHQYGRTKPEWQDLIASSRIRVIEDTEYDNWDGGIHGHDVVLYVPVEALALIDIDDQHQTQQQFAEDLRKLSQNVRGEFVSAVQFEAADENDRHFRDAVPFSGRAKIIPESLSIWKPGLIRVFISHRDRWKSQAHKLAKSLEGYGFSSFVAHDSIPANEEWRKVIVSGLETMEVMLLFLTDDFSQSTWTMQEVGFALGKGIPTVSLKLEKEDPPGFISHAQALRGSLTDLPSAAIKVAPLLANALGQRDRVQAAVIQAFIASPNWAETTERFRRMDEIVEKLDKAEVAQIIEGFRKNDQLHGAAYLRYRNHMRVRQFLERTTGTSYEVDNRSISEEIPF